MKPKFRDLAILAQACLHADAEASYTEMNQEDVFNATLVLMRVAGCYNFGRIEAGKLPIASAEAHWKAGGKALREWCKAFTGLDMHEVAKEGEA